jgi:hypothetical protein
MTQTLANGAKQCSRKESTYAPCANAGSTRRPGVEEIFPPEKVPVMGTSYRVWPDRFEIVLPNVHALRTFGSFFIKFLKFISQFINISSAHDY